MRTLFNRITRKIVLGILVVSMSFAATEMVAYAETGDTIVYITKSGSCYHNDGCASLSKSKIEVTLDNATQKYKPCSKCKPPQHEASPKTDDVIEKDTKPAEKNIEEQVWLSASGKCYHSKNNCGNMNPDKATKVSLSDAEKQGKTKCTKCWK